MPRTLEAEHRSRCSEDGSPCGSVVLWAAGLWVLASGPGDCDSGSHANQTPCADRATKTSPVSSPSRKRDSGMSTEVFALRTVASNRQETLRSRCRDRCRGRFWSVLADFFRKFRNPVAPPGSTTREGKGRTPLLAHFRCSASQNKARLVGSFCRGTNSIIRVHMFQIWRGSQASWRRAEHCPSSSFRPRQRARS